MTKHCGCLIVQPNNSIRYSIHMKKLLPIIAIILLYVPLFALAQTDPLRSLTPFLLDNSGGTNDLENLINNLYALSITLAAFLAVIKIIIGGVKWMLTDIVSTKEDAKKEIRTALLGLLIVVSAVLVLTVINPQTATINFGLDQISATSIPGFVPEFDLQPGETAVSMPCERALLSTLDGWDCDDATKECEAGGGKATETLAGESLACVYPPPEPELEPELDRLRLSVICDDPVDILNTSCDVEASNCVEDYTNGSFVQTIAPVAGLPMLDIPAIPGQGYCDYDA